MNVSIRNMVGADIEPLAKFHTDEEAAWLAGGGAISGDTATHVARFARLLDDESGELLLRTIIVDGEVAGYIATFLREDAREISYWLGRQFWGKGIVTHALKVFLLQVKEIFPDQSIYARVVESNIGSAKVLEKTGFRSLREEQFFSEARQGEVSETLYILK
ncbi:GNAT family N-acetyltransferase [Kordiimonas laminariae]|uniref:GNAT family N-acetyltransferase n=1 Tax=Kordiimonas laminariae TaxID=2917717 RepID=UPI001FF62451|nr:GNAT family N-acetyltransferase [Kordiimonas laminariae]MCK0069020.1 GNAT family N-acetyltransferase [Kordiimonas laminariae]